ncbi:MAG: response regulator [Candidatus Omnitrophota bacterium]
MEHFSVLLVDDEAELVYTLAERLVIRGCDAAAATSSGDALKILAEKKFDVVVLDVKMPGMSGIELMRAIKKTNPQIKIILQTGRGSIEESKEGIREGAFDYLVKPVQIDDLIKKMKQALGKPS